jgi:uncharacterized phiE125 gp8 family phage protein
MPVTLEDVKAHLRVTVDAEDSLLATYLAGALAWAEERTRRAIVQRAYLIVQDAFPYGDWQLPLGHIASITNIQYIDTDGATQTWGGSPLPYSLDNASNHMARLRPTPSESWPTTGDYLSAARVTVTAGWSTDDIPYTVKEAILLKVGALNETRVPGDPEMQDIEDAALALLSGWMLPVFA